MKKASIKAEERVGVLHQTACLPVERMFSVSYKQKVILNSKAVPSATRWIYMECYCSWETPGWQLNSREEHCRVVFCFPLEIAPSVFLTTPCTLPPIHWEIKFQLLTFSFISICQQMIFEPVSFISIYQQTIFESSWNLPWEASQFRGRYWVTTHHDPREHKGSHYLHDCKMIDWSVLHSGRNSCQVILIPSRSSYKIKLDPGSRSFQ